MLRTLFRNSTLLSVLAPLLVLAYQDSPNRSAAEAEARTRAELERLEYATPRIPDRGAVLFARAELYARLGDLGKSLALLSECIALDEGFDPDGYPPLGALRSFPAFGELVEQVHRLHPPVHRADIAFTIPETDLFPEGIAYDPGRHEFYLGSMYRKKIIRTTETGRAVDFVKPDRYDLGPVGGVHVDPVDHSIWAATDPLEAKPSELVHFNAQGKLLERYPTPGPGSHDLNDLVIRNLREIYLSDTFGHAAYRFDRKSHEFTALALPRPLFYPNGITVSGDASLLYVADSMGVIVVDLANNAARELDPGKGNTLAGIDGLYWYKNGLLAVQYGTGTFRVARFGLSPEGFRVTSTEILEYRSPLLTFPTTGAIAGNKFYFMTNTGIGNLHEDKIIDPKQLEPVHVAVVPLQ
jgi:sugar lactone lactonase YvrE